MWTLVDRVLSSVPLDERKTAENIREQSRQILEVRLNLYYLKFILHFFLFQEFGLDFQSSIWTTDNASNMVKAFQCLKRFGCAAHDLNLAVEHGFKNQKNEVEEDEQDSNKIMMLMKTAKNLVAYCKRSKYA